tara:strand:- start:156 stop:590 length:435 start_codon:yes stop_codon:yes gene_type:complete
MNNSRELIAQNLIGVLKSMDDPKLVQTTRDPFNVEELAITQFPACLVTTGEELRDTVSMGAGLRQATINFVIRGYVRGTDLDTRRNRLIESIEESLDSDRYRGQGNTTVLNSMISSIEVVERQAPLAEIIVNFQVTYVFARGTA